MSTVIEGLGLAARSLTKAEKTKFIRLLLEDADLREALVELLIDKLVEPVGNQKDEGRSRPRNGLETAVTSKERGRLLRERYVSELGERGIRINQVDNVWAKTPSGLWVAIPFATERKPDRWFLGLPENEVLERIRSGGVVVILLCQTASCSRLDFVIPSSIVQDIAALLSKSKGQLKFNMKKVGNSYHLVIPGRNSLDVSAYKGNLSALQAEGNLKHDPKEDDKHDPKEDDPRYKRIIEEADKEAQNNLAGEPRHRGFCHRLWAEKKRILKEKYGIDWKSPAEMNPDVIFD